jgi:hypothetical protein
MSSVEAKLEKPGLKLDGARLAIGNYMGNKKVGELLFASDRVSDLIGIIEVKMSLRIIY